MRDDDLCKALKRRYGKLLGELARIQSPPKRDTRLQADRDKHELEAPERAKRAAWIEDVLPHLAVVVKIYDPDWDETTEKPIGARQPRELLGAQTIGAAALDALRDAEHALTIAEIAMVIAARYDRDVSTVTLSQKLHTAVNNALKGRKSAYRQAIVLVSQNPERWRLAV